MKIAATGLTLALLTACGQQEEPVVVQAEEPIYAKDGTIIGMRPMVTPGGGDGSDSSMGMTSPGGDDSDDDDGNDRGDGEEDDG